MLCPKCKKTIPDGSRFCLECGSAVSSDSQAATNRVARGGCWDFGARIVRSAFRFGSWPVGVYSSLGVRACLAPRSEGK
jgi:formylglycine-generating enzyme required for sulfatase activity